MSDKRKMVVISPELHRAIKVLAAQENRTVGRQVEHLLEEALKNREGK